MVVDFCPMKSKNNLKAAAMRAHIDACRESGLTVKEYCQQQGLSRAGYYYWLRRLRPQASSGSIVPVQIHNARIGGTLEISYPNGVSLSFSGELNSNNLKALVCCI